ncbi:MAG TPA: hypothetical protein VMD27_10320 [Candidatus Aquilonibacter sp.]|nr:hypothetical protein [Candidatus Aquilonibacter sp.]
MQKISGEQTRQSEWLALSLQAGLPGFDLLQSHFVGNVFEFLMADRFKLFAARLELFVDLDGLLGHLLVGFLCATEKREIRAGGDSFVAVGIQSDSKHHGFAFFLRVQHQDSVKPPSKPVKQRIQNSRSM